MSNDFDWDLNIFQREYEVPDTSLADPSEGTVWDYAGPWYIHLYRVFEGLGHEEYGEPIELTAEEQADLINSDPYFDGEPDVWYGLEGFIQDKASKLSERLANIFTTLPYNE